MSMRLCVLGSGSSGNCSVVMLGQGTQQRCVMIDMGLSPRATGVRLRSLGLNITDICAVLITHFDTDHFYPGWLKWIAKFDLPVHVHKHHRSEALRAGLSLRQMRLYVGAVDCDACETIDTCILAHDQLGSVGFVLQHAGLRLGYATDLGRPTEGMFELFGGLHGLAIESNYDRQMQVASGRPAFLQRRIMGGAGHLSNDQSLQAVGRIAEQSRLSQIALLHLSRQCNDPELIEDLYRREAADLWPRVTVTSQFAPTACLEIGNDGEAYRPAATRLPEGRGRRKVGASQPSLFSMNVHG
jgi:phosphoribosyl 1,2-cyclic phosphodiesterase